jgi:hypothetical protein
MKFKPNPTNKAILARIHDPFTKNCRRCDGLGLNGLDTAIDCPSFNGVNRAVYMKFTSAQWRDEFFQSVWSRAKQRLPEERSFTPVGRAFPGWGASGYVNCYKNPNAMGKKAGNGSAGMKHDPTKILKEIHDAPSALVATTREGHIVTYAEGDPGTSEVEVYDWWVRQGHVERT